MKKLLLMLVCLAAAGCGGGAGNEEQKDSISGTTWSHTNESDESSTMLEFKSSELAILTLSYFEELPDTYDLYPGATYKEERKSSYFYDYIVSEGKIYLSISTASSWSFGGNLYIMPSDRFDMPSLIGSVTDNKLLLLKDAGGIYATLNKH